MDGVAAKQAKLDRYNELAMNYSDETADEMARLQDEIDAGNLWDLDAQVDVAMEALRCPPDTAEVKTLSGGERRRVALCRLLLEAPEMLLVITSYSIHYTKLYDMRRNSAGSPRISGAVPSSAQSG